MKNVDERHRDLAVAVQVRCKQQLQASKSAVVLHRCRPQVKFEAPVRRFVTKAAILSSLRDALRHVGVAIPMPRPSREIPVMAVNRRPC